MTKLITKTQEFNCQFAAEASVGVLYIIVQGAPLTVVAAVFSDPEEISVLEVVDDVSGYRKQYDGYTVMVSMNIMRGGAARVGLRRKYIGEE